MRRKTTIIAGVIAALAAGLFAAGMVRATDSAAKSGGPGPVVKIYRGGQCVEDTEYMRRHHMKVILHQRDETVHRGIRTTKHSLKNCVNCHADPATNSVLGQDGFCSSCHEYASVKIDCFSCHTDKADKGALATMPAVNAAKGAQP